MRNVIPPIVQYEKEPPNIPRGSFWSELRVVCAQIALTQGSCWLAVSCGAAIQIGTLRAVILVPYNFSLGWSLMATVRLTSSLFIVDTLLMSDLAPHRSCFHSRYRLDSRQVSSDCRFR